jgi:hypothetical protein
MTETKGNTLNEVPADSISIFQNDPAGKEDTSNISGSGEVAELKQQYPSGLAVTFILTSVTLAYFLFFLDLAVISTATPAITSQFDSLVDVGW